MSKKETKSKIAEAIMAGAKEARAGKPIPYLENEEELDFSEGKPKEEETNLTKAFQTLLSK